MSSYFPTSASTIARIRADGAPAVRERRVADDSGVERSSSKRNAHGQHIAVLNYVKHCLPEFIGASPVPIVLEVVDEDVVEEHEGGIERVYRDCILEVVADALNAVELGRLRASTRSIVSQLSAGHLVESELPNDPADGFVRHRLYNGLSPDLDPRDAALMPLLGRPITQSFKLKVPEFEDLRMSGKFVSAPESAAPAEERLFKGRIAGCSFLQKKKREFVLRMDAPAGAKTKYEELVVGYHPNQHETLVYPLLRNPEQVVHVRATSSRIQRGNGSTSNSYELAAFLSAEEVADLEVLGMSTVEGLRPVVPGENAANDASSLADALRA